MFRYVFVVASLFQGVLTRNERKPATTINMSSWVATAATEKQKVKLNYELVVCVCFSSFAEHLSWVENLVPARNPYASFANQMNIIEIRKR